MASERLQKVLAAAGIASRRKAEELITGGRVSVNGEVVTELGTKADPRMDEIRVDGNLIGRRERHVYFMLYKPKGHMTTVSDPEGRPTVMDLMRGVKERVFPVGRLDYMSEGLLLMTNDGELMAQLTAAGKHVPKTYQVKVSGHPTEEDIDKLRSGIMLPPEPGLTGARGKKQPGVERRSFAVRTQPAEVELVRDQENPWYEVTLIEGRNRQIRRMFEQIGFHVEKIKRVCYGSLELNVEPGEFRHLTVREINDLRKSLDRPYRIKPPRKAAEVEESPAKGGEVRKAPRGETRRGATAGSREYGKREARPMGKGGDREARPRRDFGDREARPKREFSDRKQAGGDRERPSRPSFERSGGDFRERPARPRREGPGDETRSRGDRPQRPRRENFGGSERPQRPRRESFGGSERSERPRRDFGGPDRPPRASRERFGEGERQGSDRPKRSFGQGGGQGGGQRGAARGGDRERSGGGGERSGGFGRGPRREFGGRSEGRGDNREFRGRRDDQRGPRGPRRDDTRDERTRVWRDTDAAEGRSEPRGRTGEDRPQRRYEPRGSESTGSGFKRSPRGPKSGGFGGRSESRGGRERKDFRGGGRPAGDRKGPRPPRRDDRDR